MGKGELCARGGRACPHLCGMWKSGVDVRSLSQSQARGGFSHCTGARLAAEFRTHLPLFPSADTGACGHALLFTWVLGI